MGCQIDDAIPNSINVGPPISRQEQLIKAATKEALATTTPAAAAAAATPAECAGT